MPRLRFPDRDLPIIIVVIVALFSIVTTPALAQFTKLRDYGSTLQGISPYASPATDGTFLYGVTSDGGINDNGTIYKMDVNGNITILYSFDANAGDGIVGSLLYDGTALYGMTLVGGANKQGSIYKINTDGTGFTNVFDFAYFTSGAFSYGGLITDGTMLYGMAGQGGNKGGGTIFKVNKDGSGFTKLYEFDNGVNGGFPYGSLVSDGTFLYGMTSEGGSGTRGVVFKIQTDGTNFTTLLTFNGVNGSFPRGSLYFDGTFLWGMTQNGGVSDKGVLFRVQTDGLNYSKFSDFNFAGDGNNPKGSLISDGTFLYGTTTMGSPGFGGTVFKIKLDGSSYTNVTQLTDASFGSRPEGTLALIGSTLFGARGVGGTAQHGQVFQVDTNGANNKITYSFQVEGNQPVGAMVSDGTYLYGVNSSGGSYDMGTIYRVKPDGTSFQKLIDFDGPTRGRRATAGLYYNSGKLYGMTSEGGANNKGILFRVNTDGSLFTDLMDFDGTNNGMTPNGSVIFDGTFLYGMTQTGGSNDRGTIFKIKPDGSNYAKLYDFADIDGSYPNGDLTLDGGVLYGLTFSGGPDDGGSAFKIDTDGSNYQVLYSFNFSPGAYPRESFCSDGTYLYGTTSNGGSANLGTIFRMMMDGSGFETLFEFTSNTGGDPQGALISDGTYLYGTTPYGGLVSKGTIFKIKTDGSGYSSMKDFNDGQNPAGTLYSDGTFLYGIASLGGKYNKGVLFKRTVAPATSISLFDPTFGSEGRYVKVSGIDFDPGDFNNNVVKFNGVTAKIVDGTPDELTVIVPTGATKGPISVTAGGITDTSVKDFDVTADADMTNGKVQTCDVTFTGVSDDDDLLMTFEPSVAGAKINVAFNNADIDDWLLVYDGPDDSLDPVDTLANSFGSSSDYSYTSTSPNGELSFRYAWQDQGSNWQAQITCVTPSVSITINQQPLDKNGCDNSKTIFTTSASGTTNITYQWQYSEDDITWIDISDGGGYTGTTTNSLQVDGSNLGLEGGYRCNINGDGAPEVTTEEALLFIYVAPGAPSATDPAPACNSTAATLTASGGTNGNYHWYTTSTGGTAISGQVNSSYTTPTITSTTTYYVTTRDIYCESNRTPIVVTVNPCNAPVIKAVDSDGAIQGTVTINLASLLTDSENNIDLSTLKIVQQPTSGATASLSGTTLTINYNGNSFTGTDDVAIEVCDATGLCTTQHFKIVIFGDVVVYNAVSPNNDGKNEFFYLEFIEVIPSKKINVVKIYNRWGEEVFTVANYNNDDRVFNGNNKHGNKLPSGTYFYKISFASGDDDRTGYLDLKY